MSSHVVIKNRYVCSIYIWSDIYQKMTETFGLKLCIQIYNKPRRGLL